MRERLSILTAVFSAAVAIAAAVNMRDHVRLVDIIVLFFGGMGAGGGLVSALRASRRSLSRQVPNEFSKDE